MAISTQKRKKIADFDPVRDGITITQFCKELKISKQTYFNIKRRLAERGRTGILPDSTAPKNPARKFTTDLHHIVLDARNTLKTQGKDHGPWSIYYYLVDELGLEQPPQRSTIAKWLHDAGVVDTNARKRPRSSYRRFARDLVGELWQIDAFVYRLFDHAHTQITIYQVLDDASRFDVGTQAFARPENGHDARATLHNAITQYGRPQEVLSDNAEAFATYHRGRLSETEKWLATQGIWAIAGFGPTTQGKDERGHQTITKYLDARQPVTLEQVQALLRDYREFYNTKRRHQSLLDGKTHITPAHAWQVMEHAIEPTTPIDPDTLWAKILRHQHSGQGSPATALVPVRNTSAYTPEEVAASSGARARDNESIQADSHTIDPSTVADQEGVLIPQWGIPGKLWVNKNGVVRVMGHGLYVGTRWKNRELLSRVSGDFAEFFTAHDGELLFSFPLPIRLKKRPAGGQVNIGLVEGMWHRQPPVMNPRLSRPRPSRRGKG